MCVSVCLREEAEGESVGFTRGIKAPESVLSLNAALIQTSERPSLNLVVWSSPPIHRQI